MGPSSLLVSKVFKLGIRELWVPYCLPLSAAAEAAVAVSTEPACSPSSCLGLETEYKLNNSMNFCRAYILTVSSDSKLLSVEFVEFKVDLFITSCFPYLYHLSTTQNPVLLSPSFPLERACSVSKSCPVMSDSL